MFKFFKKKTKNAPLIPDDYKHLVSQEQYERIIDLSRNYFTEAGKEVTQVLDGIITVKGFTGEEEHRFGLDNLVRLLAQSADDEWNTIIFNHFNKFKDNHSAYKYLFKDFDYARQFLKVLVKDESFGEEHLRDLLVKRVDFPETYTLLVLDFDDQFRFIDKESASQWEMSEEELFEIAFDNVKQENVEVQLSTWKDSEVPSEEYEVYTFFSWDFSVSYIINLRLNAEFAIGKFGSLVAIPTKGSAFIHPINNNNVLNVVNVLGDTVVKFFNEDPGNINTKFYWFYDEQFHVFPEVKKEEGYVTISRPEALANLLDREPRE